MSVDNDLRVVAKLVRAYNMRNWDLVARAHPEFIISLSPDSPEPRTRRKVIQEEFAGVAAAFQDSRLRMKRAFGQRDWVRGVFTFDGTHEGPLTGPGGQMTPATDRPLRLEHTSIYRLRDREIMERHE